MTQDIHNSDETIVDDVDKIFAISGIAISGLELLFYPAEEVADASETDLGFVGTISKVVSVLGLIGTLWTIGLLYTREVEIPAALKWILVPILVLDLLLISMLLGMLALDTASPGKVAKFAIKFLKPGLCTLGAAVMIVAMGFRPKQLLKMSFIGLVIHYLPAGLGYAPINKHPFYAIVVLVRAGGLITTLAGDVIEIATGEKPDSNAPQLEA